MTIIIIIIAIIITRERPPSAAFPEWFWVGALGWKDALETIVDWKKSDWVDDNNKYD